MKIRFRRNFITALQKTAEEIDAHFNLLRDIEGMLNSIPHGLKHFFTQAADFEQTNCIGFPAREILITPQNWDRHVVANRAIAAVQDCFSGETTKPTVEFLNCVQTEDAIRVDTSVNGIEKTLTFPFDDNYYLYFPTSIPRSPAFEAIKRACQTYGGISPAFAIQAEPSPKGGIIRFPSVCIVTNDRQTIANQVLRFRQQGPMN